jgi:ubiquinone/menaquinone biosynthesis C-methylase UbiE
MSYVDDAPGTVSGNPASDVFEREWTTYRKMVDNNYLFHREAYGRLRQILTEDMTEPFRFLDVACGDASATVEALAGTSVSHYCGIDLSSEALGIASRRLRALQCPVELERGDFAEVLARWERPVDVVWIGLSLHHLHAPRKLAVMREIRRIVGDRGLFLAYENASPDSEGRTGWLRRWDAQEPHWTAHSGEEWQTVKAHVHAYDFPETSERWNALGREAGFEEVAEIFVSPTDLFRMYLFRP